MGYKFTINGGVKVKKEGEYPWPWSGDENRKIMLYEDDVLTKSENGKYMKHTGVGCFDIILEDNEVEPIGKPVKLVML